MPNRPLENKIRQRLRGYETPLDTDALWQRVEPELPRPARPSSPGWWALGVTTLIVGLLGITLWSGSGRDGKAKLISPPQASLSQVLQPRHFPAPLVGYGGLLNDFPPTPFIPCYQMLLDHLAGKTPAIAGRKPGDTDQIANARAAARRSIARRKEQAEARQRQAGRPLTSPVPESERARAGVVIEHSRLGTVPPEILEQRRRMAARKERERAALAERQRLADARWEAEQAARKAEKEAARQAERDRRAVRMAQQSKKGSSPNTAFRPSPRTSDRARKKSKKEATEIAVAAEKEAEKERREAERIARQEEQQRAAREKEAASAAALEKRQAKEDRRKARLLARQEESRRIAEKKEAQRLAQLDAERDARERLKAERAARQAAARKKDEKAEAARMAAAEQQRKLQAAEDARRMAGRQTREKEMRPREEAETAATETTSPRKESPDSDDRAEPAAQKTVLQQRIEQEMADNAARRARAREEKADREALTQARREAAASLRREREQRRRDNLAARAEQREQNEIYRRERTLALRAERARRLEKRTAAKHQRAEFAQAQRAARAEAKQARQNDKLARKADRMAAREARKAEALARREARRQNRYNRRADRMAAREARRSDRMARRLARKERRRLARLARQERRRLRRQNNPIYWTAEPVLAASLPVRSGGTGETSLEAITVQGLVGYHRAKGLSIRGGFAFSTINSKITGERTETTTVAQTGVVAIIQNPDGTTTEQIGTVQVPQTTVTKTRYYNSVTSLDIPVLAGYKFKSGKLDLLAEAGPSLNLSSGGNAHLRMGEGFSRVPGGHFLGRRAGFGFLASLTAQYPLNERAALTGGLRIQSFGGGFEDPEVAGYQTNISLVGVQLGYRFRF